MFFFYKIAESIRVLISSSSTSPAPQVRERQNEMSGEIQLMNVKTGNINHFLIRRIIWVGVFSIYFSENCIKNDYIRNPI